jgi:hypothetical protein
MRLCEVPYTGFPTLFFCWLIPLPHKNNDVTIKRNDFRAASSKIQNKRKWEVGEQEKKKRNEKISVANSPRARFM